MTKRRASGKINEEREESCVQRFLEWYNEQQGARYTYQKAEARFSDLIGMPRWDFVAYEPDNRDKWIGIEVKEIPTLEKLDKGLHYWKDLCVEITSGLQGKIQGKYFVLPPRLNLRQGPYRKSFREAFIEVLCSKHSVLKIGKLVDIGPYIVESLVNQHKEDSRRAQEYCQFGVHPLFRLEIVKSQDTGCEVKPSGNPPPPVPESFQEMHKHALSEVLNPKDLTNMNRQLGLAKERGARMSVLLLFSVSFDDEALVSNYLLGLGDALISNIDLIYLVGEMASQSGAHKLYEKASPL